MLDESLYLATLVAALGSGLIAGVFFAFSAFVMKALARLPAAQGIAAMQSINILAITPLFMTALLGTAALSVVLVVLASIHWNPLILAGGVLYLGGVILVTRVFNIPRNDALAVMEPTSSDDAAVWAEYVRSWTLWNHVRTVAALAAATLLTISLTVGSR